MDIEKAKDIYWMIENCFNTDCDGLGDCETCDYYVTDEQADEATTLLTSAGLLDEEGDLNEYQEN